MNTASPLPLVIGAELQVSRAGAGHEVRSTKPAKRIGFQITCPLCRADHDPRLSSFVNGDATCQSCRNENNRLRRLIDRLQRTDDSPTKAATVRRQAAAAIKKLMADRDRRKARVRLHSRRPPNDPDIQGP